MEDKLNILWTNADPITSKHMVFMYAENALLRGWWKEVEIIVWGATSKLVAHDKEIQEKILAMRSNGVQFTACIACAKELGVIKELTELGLEIKSMGQPLTDLLKKDAKLLTV